MTSTADRCCGERLIREQEKRESGPSLWAPARSNMEVYSRTADVVHTVMIDLICSTFFTIQHFDPRADLLGVHSSARTTIQTPQLQRSYLSGRYKGSPKARSKLRCSYSPVKPLLTSLSDTISRRLKESKPVGYLPNSRSKSRFLKACAPGNLQNASVNIGNETTPTRYPPAIVISKRFAPLTTTPVASSPIPTPRNPTETHQGRNRKTLTGGDLALYPLVSPAGRAKDSVHS